MTTTNNKNEICKGICKNGNPCKNKASDWTTGFNGYCGKHNWDEDGNPHPPITEEKPMIDLTDAILSLIAEDEADEEKIEIIPAPELTQKEKKALYSKKYREANKEKLALKKKAYKLGKKAETSEYNKMHYLKIKDEVKVKNDDKKEDKATKVKCECGAFIRKDGLTNHKKTKKHTTGLEKL